MTSHSASSPGVELTLSPLDNRVLANLCGPLDENLRQLEIAYDVKIARRGPNFSIRGVPAHTRSAAIALEHFCDRAGHGLTMDEIQLGLVELRGKQAAPVNKVVAADDQPILQTRRADLKGRTPRQIDYLRNIQGHDITFGIGPAGTGKTYLAVACAVDALERDAVKRIVLVRPAVEAGEK
ncbi:MAG: PhoH family protein, partial [Betaproteobacteria bacterium]